MNINPAGLAESFTTLFAVKARPSSSINPAILSESLKPHFTAESQPSAQRARVARNAFPHGNSAKLTPQPCEIG